ANRVLVNRPAADSPHPHGQHATLHTVGRALVVGGLGPVVERIPHELLKITKSPVCFSVIFQVLDVVIGFGPGEAVGLLGTGNYFSDRVELRFDAADVSLCVGITGTVVGPRQGEKSTRVGIGGIGISAGVFVAIDDVVI